MRLDAKNVAAPHEAQQVLRETEKHGELVAAAFRTIVLAVLSTLALTVDAATPGQHGLIGVATLYAVITIAGVILAWLHIYRPFVPYVFVTLDLLAVIAGTLLASHMAGLPVTLAPTLPLFALIHVVLVHTALRYRPGLMLYAVSSALVLSGLSLSVIDGWLPELITMAAPHPQTPLPSPRDGMMSTHLVPIGLVALTGSLLVYLDARTRRMLREALHSRERLSRLARFFSPAVAERLADDHDPVNGGGARQVVAIMFVDIRGFTAIAEQLDAGKVGELLAAFRERIVEHVFAYGGAVDKFIGDSVLAVFGTPEPQPDDADRALRAALAILADLRDRPFPIEAVASGVLEVGIGLHYGEVFAGVIGRGRMVEHTIVGDTVNVAQRLERLTRTQDCLLIASRALIDATSERGRATAWRLLGDRELEGHARPVEAMALAQDGR